MKKILISLCLLLFVTLTVAAQSNQDVVYKKDGSEIRGTIVEQVLGEYLRIRILGGTIFQIKYEEIDKLAQEESAGSAESYLRGSRRPSIFKQPYTAKTKGLYQVAEMGMLIGQNRWGSSEGNLTFSYAIGYRFHPRLAVGLGAAYVRFTDTQTIPLYLDLRGDILPSKRNTPFYFAGFGYGIDNSESWNDEWFSIDHDGGVHTHFGVGYKAQVAKIGLLFSIGQEFQRQTTMEIQNNDGNPDTPPDFISDREITYKRLWFKLGVEF